MRRRVLFATRVALVLWLAADMSLAADRGTPAQARNMLLQAIAHYKAVGRKQALADFTARKPPFGDRDLYVFCLGPDHTLVADGGFPEIIGVSEDSVVDVHGRGLGSAARQATEAGGEAMIRYRWVNPTTHVLESKIAFFARVGADLCGVGAYIP